MPFIASAIIGALATTMGSLVGRVLLALGIGFVTYKGVDTAAGFLLDQIKSGFSQMPVDVLNFLAWTWIDKAIGMIFSAWAASMALQGIAGAVTKMRIKA